MGYLHKVSRHSCDRPKDARVGDVWQCDECKHIYMRAFLGWFNAYQDINDIWHMDTADNKTKYPPKMTIVKDE